MKATVKKRIIAYIIDIMIVISVSSIISNFIPVPDSVNKSYEKINNIVNNATEDKFDINSYIDEVNSINYDINKDTVIVSTVNIAIYLLYFVVLPLYNNGQTFGKKVLKIKISSIKNNELDSNSLFIRALILYNIWIKLQLLIFIVLFNKNTYITINTILEYAQIIMSAAIIFTVLFRKDKRGLHEIISKTKVIEEE